MDSWRFAGDQNTRLAWRWPSQRCRAQLRGATFEFTSVGDATLIGFAEPVALYEVRRFPGEGGAMRGAQPLQL